MLRISRRRFCAAAGAPGGTGRGSSMTGMDFLSRRKSTPADPAPLSAADRGGGLFHAQEQQQPGSGASTAASTGSSTSVTASGKTTVGTLATVTPPSFAPTRWMEHSSWAALGDEFKSLDSDKFLQPAPIGFLTPRAVTDVLPAEELLQKHLEMITESYSGLDVRDPKTALSAHQGDTTYVKTRLSMGDKVRAVAEFMSGHIAHQVALPQWKTLFDLQYVEMDLMFWLWVIHLILISRRAVTVNIDTWAHRREVLQELLATMYSSWERTSEEVIGRPPLGKIRNYIRDMYCVCALNLDEAMLHDGPGGDMMLMGALIKFCPLPRPEDVPVYTYYTLVHYIRFHTALLDRLSDEEFSKGNFHFLPPDDRSIFAEYTAVELDQVIRSWKADGAADVEPEQTATAPTDSTQTGGKAL